jgi:hypothetical protein
MVATRKREGDKMEWKEELTRRWRAFVADGELRDDLDRPGQKEEVNGSTGARRREEPGMVTASLGRTEFLVTGGARGGVDSLQGTLATMRGAPALDSC